MPYHFILYHRTRRKIGPICFVCKTSQLRSVSNWPMPPAILNNGTDLVKSIETRIRYSCVSQQTLDRVIRMPVIPPQKGWLPEPNSLSFHRWTGIRTLTYGIIQFELGKWRVKSNCYLAQIEYLSAGSEVLVPVYQSEWVGVGLSWEKNGDTNKLAFFHANHMESKNSLTH